MRSHDIFERSSRAVKPRKPLPLVAAASLILPGSGHLLLGRSRQGFGLLAATVVAAIGALAARTFAPDVVAPAAWLIGRLGVLAAVFAVVDAPLLAREPRWKRTERFAIPPRQAAAWNYAFYGVGHAKMDEKAAAWTAILLGGAAHVALLFVLPSHLVVLAELVPLALAAWGFRHATVLGSQRRAVFDEPDDDVPGLKTAPIAVLPGWMPLVQGVAVAVLIATGIAAWSAHGAWLDARSVDREQALAHEPFYRNPAYGLQLEMRAPGWTFRQDDPALFLEAVHIGEKSRMEVRLLPRLPGGDRAQNARKAFIDALFASGLEVTTADASIESGPLSTVRLAATGTRNGQAREVAGIAYDHRFERFLLHMEWDRDHADFSVAEWDFVLNGLTIRDRAFGPAVVAR